MTTMMNIIKSFTEAKSLVSDMQSYNTFRVSHISPVAHPLQSILASEAILSPHGNLKFKRDFTFGITVGVKSATKTITENNAATYKINILDRADDYVIVEASKQETNNQPCIIDKFDCYSLANPKYFDLDRSYYDAKANKYVIVVDLYKLGVMTDKQKKDCKKFIHELEKVGLNCNYQTICCIVDRNNNSAKVGLYSLDQERVFGHTLTLFDEHIDLLSENVEDILSDVKMCSF